jgi:hypothetical protein
MVSGVLQVTPNALRDAAAQAQRVAEGLAGAVQQADNGVGPALHGVNLGWSSTAALAAMTEGWEPALCAAGSDIAGDAAKLRAAASAYDRADAQGAGLLTPGHLNLRLE